MFLRKILLRCLVESFIKRVIILAGGRGTGAHGALVLPLHPTKERMMKQDIHPDYHEITVVMTDGTEYKTRTTWGKPGDVMRLDVDPKTHPAWQGGEAKVVEKGQLKKFEGRFGSFMSGGAVSGKKKDGKDGAAA